MCFKQNDISAFKKPDWKWFDFIRVATFFLLCGEGHLRYMLTKYYENSFCEFRKVGSTREHRTMRYTDKTFKKHFIKRKGAVILGNESIALGQILKFVHFKSRMNKLFMKVIENVLEAQYV